MTTLTRPAHDLFVAPHDLAPKRRIPYEPALDGLRGLAVAAVLAYHSRLTIGGHEVAKGGYLGVDAFFVLSGFLITSLLLAEWRERGGVDIVRFWFHRARRLLPALLILLLGIGGFALWIATPDNLEQLRWDSISSLFYAANWRLSASSQSYFDQFFVSPLRHTWSLAIEEQYYLIWPWIVLLVVRHGRGARGLALVSGGAALASAALMAVLYDPAVDPSRLYYGTDTRVQSLLVGSALAAATLGTTRFRTTTARRRLLYAAVPAVLLLAVAWSRLPATSAFLYRGGFLLTAVATGVVILTCTQGGANPVRSALGVAPLRWLGLISYGVYLFHWPIFLVLSPERTGLEGGGLALFAVRVSATLLVAVASYLLVERPIRRGALRELRLSGALVPVPILLVLMVLVATTAGGRATLSFPGGFDASERPPPTGVAADEAAPVLLVGDSVAYTIGTGFENDVDQQAGLAVWNQAVLFCELLQADRRELGEVKPPSDTCLDWDGDWRRAVEIFDPEVAVLHVGAWEIFDRRFDGEWLTFGDPAYDERLLAALDDAVDALSSKGATVALVTTPAFVRPDDGAVAKEWTAPEAWRTEHFDDLLRTVAARHPDQVRIIDLAQFICPDGQCREEIDGVQIRADGLHYKGDDATLVARWLAPQLRALANEREASTPEGTGPGANPGPVSGGSTTSLPPDRKP